MGARALRIIVIVLGILVLVAFAAVVWGIVGVTDEDGNAVLGTLPGELSLGLPSPLCRIVAAQPTDDGRLFVTTDGPQDLPACNRVTIVDLATGRIEAAILP